MTNNYSNNTDKYLAVDSYNQTSKVVLIVKI